MGEVLTIEGFGPAKVGDVLTCRQVRRVPLGPFAGTLIVPDMQQEVEEVHEQLRVGLEAEGIGTARVYGRAEWLGVFDYEVEVHLQIVMLIPKQGQPVEELQANVLFVFKAIVVVALAYALVFVVDDVRGSVEAVRDASGPFSIFGVALGLIALAFIVYQLNKGSAHGTA